MVEPERDRAGGRRERARWDQVGVKRTTADLKGENE